MTNDWKLFFSIVAAVAGVAYVGFATVQRARLEDEVRSLRNRVEFIDNSREMLWSSMRETGRDIELLRKVNAVTDAWMIGISRDLHELRKKDCK